MQGEICRFTIPGNLVGLNEYIRFSRINKYKANDTKKKEEKRISDEILAQGINKINKIESYPIGVLINWFELNKSKKQTNRDPDNIIFAKKFILDSLQTTGVIANDNMKHIGNIQDNVFYVDENPHIEVILYNLSTEIENSSFDKDNLIFKFEVMGRLPDLNSFDKENRTYRTKGNTMKRKAESLIRWSILEQLNYKERSPIKDFPVIFNIIWYEDKRGRDVDNIQFAIKFILDAMQGLNILPNDNNQYIQGFNQKVIKTTGEAKVVIEVYKK